MPLSPETSAILGCTDTPEELETALEQLRVESEERDKEFKLAQMSIEERFNEYEKTVKHLPTEKGEVDPVRALSMTSIEERFRKYTEENDQKQCTSRSKRCSKN